MSICRRAARAATLLGALLGSGAALAQADGPTAEEALRSCIHALDEADDRLTAAVRTLERVEPPQACPVDRSDALARAEEALRSAEDAQRRAEDALRSAEDAAARERDGRARAEADLARTERRAAELEATLVDAAAAWIEAEIAGAPGCNSVQVERDAARLVVSGAARDAAALTARLDAIARAVAPVRIEPRITEAAICGRALSDGFQALTDEAGAVLIATPGRIADDVFARLPTEDECAALGARIDAAFASGALAADITPSVWVRSASVPGAVELCSRSDAGWVITLRGIPNTEALVVLR